MFFDALDTSYLPGGGKWHPGALMISLLWPETIQALSISAAEIATAAGVFEHMGLKGIHQHTVSW